jgi:hypothetical protein
VVLSERPRAEVAGSLGVSEEELAKLLATARKELRQTVITLGGSGWCERAEGLISDRLDGILAGRDTRRLDVHLRNCARCVEHERRLVQATDALVGGVSGATRGATPAGEAAPLVEAPPPDEGVEPPDDGVEGGIPPVAAAPPDEGIEGGPAEAARPADSTDAAEAAPTREQVAAAAEVLVASRTRRQVAAALAWNSLVALAILLTLATIALTIAGILGAKL